MSDQAQAEYRKPGVGDFLSLTFDYLKGDAKGLLRVLPLPWLLLLLPVGVTVWFTFQMQAGMPLSMEQGGVMAAGFLAVVLVEILAYAGLSVMIHRRMALGPRVAGGFRFGRRELFYLLKYIALLILMMLPVGAMGAAGIFAVTLFPEGSALYFWVPALIWIAAFVFMTVLGTRFMLAMPAFAMDRHPGVIGPMKESWRRTRGFFWRLFLGMIVIMLISMLVSIVPMAATIPFTFGDMLANSAPSVVTLIATAVGQSLMMLINLVLLMAYFTSAYIFLWAHPDRAAENAARAAGA
ncbi:MAG: glycerophosphoryl diester phosphodiesterase membrane domain-containing protein [Rhodobacterales bacterium]|nr:glycerophosphoryl diester phosphodiesterase membrane domain-containing protein [Rhodobacterales bacterium]